MRHLTLLCAAFLIAGCSRQPIAEQPGKGPEKGDEDQPIKVADNDGGTPPPIQKDKKGGPPADSRAPQYIRISHHKSFHYDDDSGVYVMDGGFMDACLEGDSVKKPTDKEWSAEFSLSGGRKFTLSSTDHNKVAIDFGNIPVLVKPTYFEIPDDQLGTVELKVNGSAPYQYPGAGTGNPRNFQLHYCNSTAKCAAACQ